MIYLVVSDADEAVAYCINPAHFMYDTGRKKVGHIFKPFLINAWQVGTMFIDIGGANQAN